MRTRVRIDKLVLYSLVGFSAVYYCHLYQSLHSYTYSMSDHITASVLLCHALGRYIQVFFTINNLHGLGTIFVLALLTEQALSDGCRRIKWSR